MNVQVLVATMKQKNIESLLEKMNVSSNAIVANQTDYFSHEQIQYKGNQIEVYNFDERGLGLNRANALMRSNGDVCLIADDDMVYRNEYTKIVDEYFHKIKDADVIIFNIKEKEQKRHIDKKIHRVRWYNFMRYGSVRIAFKRKAVQMNSISFNVKFGARFRSFICRRYLVFGTMP